MIPSLNISKNFAYVLTSAALLISLSLESAQQRMAQKQETEADIYNSLLTNEIQQTQRISNVQQTMYQANFVGLEESNKPAQTVRALKRVAVISDSDDSDSDSNNDSDDENGSESRVVQIPPRKGTRATCFSDNNSATVFNLMKHDKEIAAFIAAFTEKENKKKVELQQLLTTINLDATSTEQVLSTKRLIQLEPPGNILEQSPLLNYFVILSYDLKKLYIYTWSSIIASHNCYTCQRFTKEIDSFQFVLNDFCLDVKFKDKTNIICLLKDAQRNAAIEEEKQANKKFKEEMSELEKYPFAMRMTVAFQQQQSTQQPPTQLFSYPTSGNIITDCNDFYWNQTTSLQWTYITEEETMQMLAQPGCREIGAFGVNIITQENSSLLKIHVPEIGLISQIDNHDIEACNFLPGDPFVISLYTADKKCHVVLVGNKTLIPIISGITNIMRGPRNYLIVQKNNAWFILNINPGKSAQPPSPTSATSSESNRSESASGTPSPSTSQCHLVTLVNSGSNSPSTPRTETSTPTEPSYTTSGSTSSATACSAPATSPIDMYQKCPCIGVFSTSDSCVAF